MVPVSERIQILSDLEICALSTAMLAVPPDGAGGIQMHFPGREDEGTSPFLKEPNTRAIAVVEVLTQKSVPPVGAAASST